MSSNDESAAVHTLPQLPSDEVAGRSLGRAMVGLGGLGVLFGLFLPLAHDPHFDATYSLMGSRQFGTPGVWVLLIGTVLLLLAACLMFERVQTPEKLAALLVLACIEVVGSVFATTVAFILIWTDSRSHITGADFRYGTAVLLLSSALTIAGAVWWCIHGKRAKRP
ncbi:hypothetical protein [Nocardia sp. CA-119907]|uniref:hypothetical protein n=1 Tax=Nocardia sp. CA-119907 TaxID=3239973 RepID=UPI003D98AA5C